MKKNKIYIKSYGCQMNVYDSNRILDLFKSKNYEKVEDPKDANLVVLILVTLERRQQKKYILTLEELIKLKKLNQKMILSLLLLAV